MLYWLLYQKLFVYIHAFRVFRYLTIRTAFATLTALLIGLLIGPYLIQKLREFQIGQYIRDDGPKDHQKKAGTPTMGGLLICVAILVPTLLWSDLANPLVWLAILALVGFGGIGFADDYLKVVHKRNLGLTARVKFTAQIGVAALIAVFLLLLRSKGAYSTRPTKVPYGRLDTGAGRVDIMAGTPDTGVSPSATMVEFTMVAAIGDMDTAAATGIMAITTTTAM